MQAAENADPSTPVGMTRFVGAAVARFASGYGPSEGDRYNCEGFTSEEPTILSLRQWLGSAERAFGHGMPCPY